MHKIDIVLDAISDSSERFELTCWKAESGSTVGWHDVLLEVENDKATMEVTPPIPKGHEGTLRILIKEGKCLEVGTKIGYLEVSEETYREWLRINNFFSVHFRYEEDEFMIFEQLRGDQSAHGYVKSLVDSEIEKRKHIQSGDEQ